MLTKTKKTKGEVVRVQVELDWGREWNGSYYARTDGKGCHVQVMEHEPIARERGPGFSGCPLGSGGTEEAAIRDFVNRSRYEYRGRQPLTVSMIQVARICDHRGGRHDWIYPAATAEEALLLARCLGLVAYESEDGRFFCISTYGFEAQEGAGLPMALLITDGTGNVMRDYRNWKLDS